MTSIILRVRHETEFRYAGRVELAAHVLHLRPRELPWQRVHGFTLRTSAKQARVTERHDHFGNPVSRLFLEQGHAALAIASEAVVELRRRDPPVAAATPAWESVAIAAQAPPFAGEVAEFAYASPLAPCPPAARAWAAGSFPPGRPVLVGALDLIGRMGREFRLQPGGATVSTSVERVLQSRAGGCGDLAHLMIASLRALRLPARYVSGYVRARRPPGPARRRGADGLQGWVGCWLGPDCGWIDLDPIDGPIVGEERVSLGWGRDDADVSPVHVLLGGGARTRSVRVNIDMLQDAAAPGGLGANAA